MLRLSVVALSFFVAAPAMARTATNYTTRGDYVTASWSQFSTDGCSQEYVAVSAFDGRTHTSGAPTTTDYGYVYFGSLNYCTGAFTYYYGELDTVSTTVGGHSASVSGSGTIYDYYTGAALPVTVSGTVTDDGYSGRGMSNQKYDYLGTTYIYRTNGSYAYGTSTVTLNGTTYNGGDFSGSFGTSNSGSLTIIE